MSEKERVELLAPAGNVEGFYGAVHGGADAVYLGGSRFGARAYAENFTRSELVECIRYGHLLGRRIYLTVNTLFKENELSELYDYLSPFYEAGLDAAIVQDMGVLRFIRKHFPALKLHASTQMTLCSHYGAGFLKELGVSRIVPARELCLQELSEIKGRVDIELETFVHGAMCYCYSGQCLFSSILGGRSGNRGRCAQPCRLPYKAGTGRRQSGVCYPLSLKDMCAIGHIPQLIGAGIDSFKIEGRMKKPEYAAGVTALYRKYIDQYYEMRERCGEETAAREYKVSPEDLKALSSLYIRSGKQDGYYFKHNGRDMVTLHSPSYSGNDEHLLSEIKARYLENRLKLPVTVAGSFVAGLPAEVTLALESCGLSVTVEGAPVDRARKQPVTEENVRRQLGKLGESAFVPESMELKVGEDAFYPLKHINELRREAVAKLEQSLLEKNGYGGRDRSFPEEAAGQEPGKGSRSRIITNPRCGSPGISLSVRTFSQLQGVAGWAAKQPGTGLKRLYIDGDLLTRQTRETIALCGKLPDGVELYMALPYVLRQRDDIYLEAIDGIMEKYPLFSGLLARSLDGLAYARRRGYQIRLDANVYCWNSMAAEELQAFAAGLCLPLELNGGEQRKLLEKCGDMFDDMQFEKIVYGRIPMMVTANCLLKTMEGCQPESGERTVLIDRYHKEFPVVGSCAHCMNIIYNSVPLSLHQELGRWRDRTDIRLDFTVESGEETAGILEAFFEKGGFPYGGYTAGHEKRGVE